MDREKLIEALDKCYGQPETCGVSSCPYWDLRDPYCECEDRMRKDAIALLKEQEERIKILEHQIETITKWRAHAGAFD